LRIHPATKFRATSAFVLAATSGLRLEEVTNLSGKDIDLENRIVYVRAEKSKEKESTAFNHEGSAILRYYFEIYDGRKELFSQKSIEYVYSFLSKISPQKSPKFAKI